MSSQPHGNAPSLGKLLFKIGVKLAIKAIQKGIEHQRAKAQATARPPTAGGV